MFKLLFKNLLLANYSFAKRWVNKKMPQNIVPATLHSFTSPFTFILAGFYMMALGCIEFKFSSFPPIFIGMAIIMLTSHFYIRKKANKALHDWKIIRIHKNLINQQKTWKNITAFFYFWFGFATYIHLTIKYTDGYLVD